MAPCPADVTLQVNDLKAPPPSSHNALEVLQIIANHRTGPYCPPPASLQTMTLLLMPVRVCFHQLLHGIPVNA